MLGARDDRPDDAVAADVLGQRPRAAEVPALAERGAERPRAQDVVLGLDTLGEDGGAGRLGVGRNGVGHAGARQAGAGLHEAQVELDDVGAQDREQRERAGIGADVVKCDATARGAQALDDPQQLCWAAGQVALGELGHDDELAQRPADEPLVALGHAVPDRPGLDVHEERGRRAQACLQRPAHGGGAAGPVQVDDPPGSRRGAEQLGRHRQRRALGAAGERLVSDDRAGVEVDDRLVEGAKPVGREEVVEL
jgi:hypothetical protein